MGMYYKEKWDALKAEVDRRGADGAEFVAALEELYSVYDDEMLVWLAKLYDKDAGGFYYSNSARDNDYVEFEGVEYSLLPDIESTNQATNILKDNRVINDFSELPEKMRDEMQKFFFRRLDPENGFFYHPQWQKQLTDSRPSRRGRDLMWAEDMAKKFSWSYPYPTANMRLEGMKSDESSAEKIPEYLRTKEKFLEYLNHFDWENQAYPSGNELAAQAYPIKAAGLEDVAIDYLNSIQDPKTGLWGAKGGYMAVNGYLKISFLYNYFGKIIPNADKAAVATMKCLISDEPVLTVCFQYNCWFSLLNIIETLTAVGGDEGKKEADKISCELLKLAPEALRATKRKLLLFRKSDHSFSFVPTESSFLSQGMPVAIQHTNEGDVNASVLCTSGTVRRIYLALGLYDFFIPIFSPTGYDKFLENLTI